MDKKLFVGVSCETIDQLNQTGKALAESNLATQKAQIMQDSPYSDQINQAFSGYQEFSYLTSLDLLEADVTRRSLIRNINLNLFVSCKKRTNYELMCQGYAPYDKDDPDSIIVLHHIGQAVGAPFAELTLAEHAQYGNSKLLHTSTEESWRRAPELEKEYTAEKTAYWKKRARNDIKIYEKRTVTLSEQGAPLRFDQTRNTMRAIERLFEESNIAELNYISNLAQSYILTKEVGARSVEEFIHILNGEEDKNIKCPVCKSENILLYGSYQTDKERKQKHKCKSCGKVFSAFYNTIIQGCTLTLFEWLRFIDCLYNGYSIKKTAEICNMSEQTAFQHRLRLFYALSLLDERVVLSGNIVIDEKYEAVSYKGNHTQQADFSMPRSAHERGHENHTPGLSKNQACIICALDEYGNSVAIVAGTGSPTAAKINGALLKHIDVLSVEMLYSDKSRAIRRFAQFNELPISQTCLKKPDYKKNGGYENIRQLQRINAYHSRLDKFLSLFNGTSTDLLQGYVSLFAWKERNRDNPLVVAYKELLCVMVEPNLYKSSDRCINEHSGSFDRIDVSAEKSFCFKDKESEKKSKEMYELFAKGMTMTQIAKKHGCTKQAVSQRINRLRQIGLAYETEKEKEKEKAKWSAHSVFQEFEIKKLEKHKQYCDRWLEMLEKKNSWKGTQNDFFTEMEKLYGVSRQTIMNNIARAKRILNLREAFYISEEYEYLTLQEVFEQVYQRYTDIKSIHPEYSREYCYSLLEKEYAYKKGMITAIVMAMECNSVDWNGKLKVKIPMAHTLNRDRSVFIDCLKWTGSKADFYKYAEQKYHISPRTVSEIILLNCMADPKRYEISKLS